ncbi:MAG TPA: peptidoglycan DD-metalloendopeptidase family protein [Rhizomicrobium sp.]|nr:peptidoglycan DD-metalloendopeptidase family protein [Rhizomicrobium sp.]
MEGTLFERAWAWIHTTFPERQIYIRSDGRVQFFTFSPVLQATMAGLSLIFLGWVAFASVNVMFKDRIIAAKDHRYQQMQATYENRVADLQLSYDELQGALVGAEDKFKSVADELQTKQQAVASLLSRKQMVDTTLESLSGGTRGALGGASGDIPRAANAGAASDSVGSVSPATGSLISPENSNSGDAGSSELSVMPEPPPAQPRTAHPTRASFLDETVGRLAGAAGALFHRTAAAQPRDPGMPRNPAFRILAQQTERVTRLSSLETSLLQGVDHQVATRVDALEALLRRVGMDPAVFEPGGQGAAIGGPDVPMQQVHIDGIADAAFTAAYAGASAHGKELDSLFSGLKHVPLTTPVHGAGFELTSDFGPRIDPFTHRVSFHPGLDFAGAWGSTVTSTAPGVVVFAGPRGGYGNMVEIDHGYGLHTRYGHLASILVHVGARVNKGAPVGRLGSTGRSTGPHVHYEVWLADVVRDPSRFIEAGRHVLQQE